MHFRRRQQVHQHGGGGRSGEKAGKHEEQDSRRRPRWKRRGNGRPPPTYNAKAAIPATITETMMRSHARSIRIGYSHGPQLPSNRAKTNASTSQSPVRSTGHVVIEPVSYRISYARLTVASGLIHPVGALFSASRARPTFSMISSAVFRQTNGLGSLLCWSM